MTMYMNSKKLRMSLTSDQLLKKFKALADNVKQDLKKKGYAIPLERENGSISLENYVIEKDLDGFFCIKNHVGDVIQKNINLPQSALLIANAFAVGKMGDKNIYNLDQEYGYGVFEMTLLKKNANRSLKKKNIDRADFLYTKLKILEFRVRSTKNTIISRFEKLRNLH